jgi:hypothetical protein
MADDGLDMDWYDRHAPRTRSCLGPHLGRPAQGLLWQDWQDAARARPSRTAAGPLLRLRRLHRLRDRARRRLAVPPAGGSQGTGQDLSPQRRGAGRARPAGRGRGARSCASGSRRGKIRFISHRDLGPGLGAACIERRPACVHRGLLARAQARASAGAVRRARERGEYLDVTCDEGASTSPRAVGSLPAMGMTCRTAALADRAGPALQAAVTGCTWHLQCWTSTSAPSGGRGRPGPPSRRSITRAEGSARSPTLARHRSPMLTPGTSPITGPSEPETSRCSNRGTPRACPGHHASTDLRGPGQRTNGRWSTAPARLRSSAQADALHASRAAS